MLRAPRCAENGRRRVLARPAAVIAMVIALAGCGATVAGQPGPAGRPQPGQPSAPGGTALTKLADGPVTYVALGDSLTAAEGDDAGIGFTGRLAEAVTAAPGREGSTFVNLGQSGWDSTQMVEGQLSSAVDQIRSTGNPAVLATVLIGSNDLWYAYQNSVGVPTSAAEEDAVVETYRSNLDRTVSELQAAGALVVLGLPDDQSLRPIALDIGRLNQQLSDVTSEEIAQMSVLSKRFGQVVMEVAAARGTATVDTNDPLWADPARMAEDGIHPNAAGYTDLAARWLPAIQPAL